MLGSHIDITARKKNEQTVKRSEHLLRLFVEHAPAAIAMFNHEMKYLAVSQRVLEDYRLGDQTLIGRTHYDVFPEIPERWKEIHRRCLAGNIEKCDADPFPRADGRLDWIRWEIHPWYETAGKIGGIILFSEVITKRVQTEKALRQSHNQLRLLTARLAEVEETQRRYLVRELHDQVGQNLTALSINLNLVGSLLPPESREFVQAKLKDSQELIEETSTRIRDLMAELRPPELDDYGLAAALRWYGDRLTARTGLKIFTPIGNIQRLPLNTELTLFRIAQEALTNITKHSRASQATIELEVEGEFARLTISDNGIGFDPTSEHSQNKGGGWGLPIMKERAETVGASFRIESESGKGTRVIIEVSDDDKDIIG